MQPATSIWHTLNHRCWSILLDACYSRIESWDCHGAWNHSNCNVRSGDAALGRLKNNWSGQQRQRRPCPFVSILLTEFSFRETMITAFERCYRETIMLLSEIRWVVFDVGNIIIGIISVVDNPEWFQILWFYRVIIFEIKNKCKFKKVEDIKIQYKWFTIKKNV